MNRQDGVFGIFQTEKSRRSRERERDMGNKSASKEMEENAHKNSRWKYINCTNTLTKAAKLTKDRLSGATNTTTTTSRLKIGCSPAPPPPLATISPKTRAPSLSLPFAPSSTVYSHRCNAVAILSLFGLVPSFFIISTSLCRPSIVVSISEQLMSLSNLLCPGNIFLGIFICRPRPYYCHRYSVCIVRTRVCVCLRAWVVAQQA